MVGEASAKGAVSIVNAIASGKGATVSVDLPTSARLTIGEGSGGWQTIENGRKTRSRLALETVRQAMAMLGKDPRGYSGSVETICSTPVGVGLKTSSAVSVAIALGVCDAFGEGPPRTSEILDCSIRSSLSSGVSVTGAMDDAASCLLGGANFVDNSARKILSSRRLRKPLRVVVRVPRGRSRRGDVPVSHVRKFSDVADSIFAIGLEGNAWCAMTLNGLMYSSIYGYDPRAALQALESGALGAGLSGTGPAVAAVFDGKRAAEELAKVWKEDGAQVLTTMTSDGGATVDS